MSISIRGWLAQRLGTWPWRTRHRYWEARAARLGAGAVLHVGHAADSVEEVTRRHQEILLPLLAGQLRGDEALILDFGCGPGRFAPALADITGGRVLALDPIRSLLDLAPAHQRVEYRLLPDWRLPLPAASIDLIWICLVLGGISGKRALRRTVRELERVLRPSGLLFLVENTTPRPPAGYWTYRSVQDYRALFSFAALEHLADYDDLGEQSSVLSGRKASSSTEVRGSFR